MGDDDEEEEQEPQVSGDHIDFRYATIHGNVIGVDYGGRTSPSASLSTLPAAPTVFTGREGEVAELFRALDPAVGEGAESVVISAVAGLCGVGKTALALHTAHKAREQGWFPGGAIFVDLRGYDEVPLPADEAVLSLLRALGALTADLPPTPDERYARYRAELSRRKPLLVVLDNVSDPAQITPLLPGGGGHRVLVTSRDAQYSLPARQLHVEALTPEASRELIDRSLRQTSPDDQRVSDEPEAVARLTELCGHLPLALLIAAALLRRRRQRPVSTLTAELRAATDRVRRLQARGVDQYGKELSLRPVFDVMYARLGPELGHVFRQLGQAPGDGIAMASAANLTALPPERLEPLLDDLTATSLLTVLPSGCHWRMHDLVRTYARTLAEEDTEFLDAAAEARLRLLHYYSRVTRCATTYMGEDPSNEFPDVFRGNRKHAVEWLTSERRGLVEAAQWAANRDCPEAVELSVLLSYLLRRYLLRIRAFDDLLLVAQAAREGASTLDQVDYEAMSLESTGQALHGLRRYDEAVEVYHQALDIWDRIGDRRSQAGAWNNLANSERRRGRRQQALEAHFSALLIFEELGETHEEANVHTNIASDLAELGRLDRASIHYGKAVDIYRAQGDVHGEAGAVNGLGAVFLLLGQLAEATTAFTRAGELFGDLNDSHGLALVWHHFGLVLAEDGRPDEALSAFDRAWQLLKACNDWYAVGHAARGVAETLETQGRIREAATIWGAVADAYDRAQAADEAAWARRQAEA